MSFYKIQQPLKRGSRLDQRLAVACKIYENACLIITFNFVHTKNMMNRI